MDEHLTQEWTPEGNTVIAKPSLWRFIVANEVQAKTICDAHNAALAAENVREIELICELQRQLAAEREKVKPLVDALEWVADNTMQDRVSKRISRILDDLAKVKEKDK